jgi:uncharacterized protein YggE
LSKHLVCCIVALAAAVLPLPSPAQTATLPSGVSVTASATAYTTDVLASFAATVALRADAAAKSSADAAAQARAAFGRIATAEGASARVTDMGLSVDLQSGKLLENVQIAVRPEDANHAIAAAKSAGAAASASTPVDIIARDPQALQTEALANATKLARTRAEAVAAADGRHVGRLLDVTPSPAEIAKDVAASATGALGPLMAAIQARTGAAGAKTAGASATAEAVFTFELLP